MKFVSSQIALLSLTVCTAVSAPCRLAATVRTRTSTTRFARLGLMTTTEKDLGHPGLTQNTKRYADIAQACSVEAKRRLDGGEAADTLVKLTSNAGASSNVKLGDVEATGVPPARRQGQGPGPTRRRPRTTRPTRPSPHRTRP